MEANWKHNSHTPSSGRVGGFSATIQSLRPTSHGLATSSETTVSHRPLRNRVFLDRAQLCIDHSDYALLPSRSCNSSPEVGKHAFLKLQVVGIFFWGGGRAPPTIFFVFCFFLISKTLIKVNGGRKNTPLSNLAGISFACFCACLVIRINDAPTWLTWGPERFDHLFHTYEIAVPTHPD